MSQWFARLAGIRPRRPLRGWSRRIGAFVVVERRSDAQRTSGTSREAPEPALVGTCCPGGAGIGHRARHRGVRDGHRYRLRAARRAARRNATNDDQLADDITRRGHHADHSRGAPSEAEPDASRSGDQRDNRRQRRASCAAARTGADKRAADPLTVDKRAPVTSGVIGDIDACAAHAGTVNEQAVPDPEPAHAGALHSLTASRGRRGRLGRRAMPDRREVERPHPRAREVIDPRALRAVGPRRLQ